MKIYLATTTIDDVIIENAKRILCSYFYFGKKIMLLKKIVKNGIDLFMDSGAFSAYNSNVNINLNYYSLYLKSLNIKNYAALDVIGNPEKSYNNSFIMKQQGLIPIPAFHIGEELKYLIQIIKEYDYIALGGMVMAGNIENWLDGVFKIILEKKPSLKVHGFGLTDQILVEKYPWYSIDSSSFDRAQRFGIVTLIDYKNKIYTIHLNEWREEQLKKGISKKLLNDNKYIRDETVKIGINTFLQYEKYITELQKTKDFSYLTAQKTLF